MIVEIAASGLENDQLTKPIASRTTGRMNPYFNVQIQTIVKMIDAEAMMRGGVIEGCPGTIWFLSKPCRRIAYATPFPLPTPFEASGQKAVADSARFRRF